MGTFEAWLHTLGTQVTAEPLYASNLPRAAQLLNKTNQMNLATRRLTEVELAAWAQASNHRLWTFRVADKFGDSGLTGIASLELGSDTATVVDFVLSCRVMGRRVEETMVQVLAQAAQHAGMATLQARYRPTPKNAVCLTFWQDQSGFEQVAGGEVFTLRLEGVYQAPEGVDLMIKGSP